MKILKLRSFEPTPTNFTGIINDEEGSYWYKEGNQHREDGPAIEYADGFKGWYLNGKQYIKIVLSDYLILDYDKGEYGLMWYKLLDKDRIFECPDIPGLITK